MGRHSPQMKKAQRKHQKAKRKLSFTRKVPTYADNFPTSSFMDSPNEAAKTLMMKSLMHLGRIWMLLR